MYESNWKFFKCYQIIIPILQNVGKCGHMNLVQIGILLNQIALKNPLKKWLFHIDVIILNKSPACICNTDAEASFDRVLPWINNQGLRLLGLSKQFTQTLATFYTHSKHNLVNKTGVYNDSYSGTLDQPLCGLGQGSTFTALGWEILSFFFFNMINKKIKGL